VRDKNNGNKKLTCQISSWRSRI